MNAVHLFFEWKPLLTTNFLFFVFFYGTLHEFTCHPYAGAMLISVSFQFFSICAAKASTLNQL